MRRRRFLLVFLAVLGLRWGQRLRSIVPLHGLGLWLRRSGDGELDWGGWLIHLGEKGAVYGDVVEM